MKQVTKVSPRAKRNAFGRLLTPTLAIVAAATALLPTNNAIAGEVDLTAVGVGVDQTKDVPASIGGNGLVANFHTQPAGTGVFDPFLTVERDPNAAIPGIERGYNTDGVLYLDQQRPTWNKLVKISDLAIIDPTMTVGAITASSWTQMNQERTRVSSRLTTFASTRRLKTTLALFRATKPILIRWETWRGR